MVGAIQGGIKDVPAETVRHCRTYQDALKVGMALAPDKPTWTDVGERLGIDGGQWNRILNCNLEGGSRARFMNPAKFVLFQQIVQNNALHKFFELEGKGLLAHQQIDKAARKAELLAELKALEAA